MVQARAELPRLGRHAVGGVVHVLRGLDERAFSRRLARMDEPAEAVVLVAVLLRDLAVTARGILPREGIVTAVVVVVRSNVFLLMRRPVDVIIRGGALPVKRVIGVADAVFVAVSHFRQTAVIDVALIFVSREGDGRCVSRALRARGADLHARHVAEGVVAQQVVLPEGVDVLPAGGRRLRERLADEVGQLRAVVVIVDGGRAVDVREIHTVGVVGIMEALFGAVGRRRPEQARGAGFVFVLRRDAVGIRGLRAEAAGAVVDVIRLEIVPAGADARYTRRGAAGGVVVGVVRQPGERVLLEVVARVIGERVLCAAGRGVALEALGVGKELAGRLGVAVRRRDGVALAVIAVGLRRFEHEADVGEVVVEAHVLLFNRHDLHFTPLAKSAISRHRLESC